jgi:hypothetical protein
MELSGLKETLDCHMAATWAGVRECPLKALAAMSPGTTNDPRDRIRAPSAD